MCASVVFVCDLAALRRATSRKGPEMTSQLLKIRGFASLWCCYRDFIDSAAFARDCRTGNAV